MEQKQLKLIDEFIVMQIAAMSYVELIAYLRDENPNVAIPVSMLLEKAEECEKRASIKIEPLQKLLGD